MTQRASPVPGGGCTCPAQEVFFYHQFGKYCQETLMAQFRYHRIHQLQPRPGYPFATAYYKQEPGEYQRLRAWLIATGESITQAAEADPSLAQWLSQPCRDFPKSRRGEYYTPEELIVDMIRQVSLNRDLPRAMTDRWNRLCDRTPWQIEWVEAKPGAKP